MAEIEPDDGFLTRWSRRKAQVRQGQPAPEAPPLPAQPLAVPAPAATTKATEAVAAEAPPPEPAAPSPTREDVERLTSASDFARFVAPQVTPDVRNAALKKLFADPHFNVMDGLDTYIEDYGKPDPLPAGMLRKMAQSKLLNLFDDDDEPDSGSVPAVAAPPLPPETPADEDPALRLQPHDAAGPPGAEPGTVEDAGGQR